MQLGRFACALAATLIACGGDDAPAVHDAPPAPAGPALTTASDLVIVAHQGDELRFMASDLAARIGQAPVTTVYVTAGTDESQTTSDDVDRARGVQAAYGFLAGAAADGWQCGAIQIAEHTASHCRHAAAQLSLVFLDLPAGNHDGSATESLRHLWEAKSPTVHAVTHSDEAYNQAQLIEVLSQIIATSGPETLRTLEIASTHGDDHSDHMLVGAAAWLALAATPLPSQGAPALLAYRGDNIAGEAANAPASDRVQQAFGYVAACTTGCAPCGQACTTAQLAPGDLALLDRSYPVGAQTATAGQFAIGGQCAVFAKAGDNGALAPCAGAEADFAYAPSTLLVTGGPGCVSAVFTGEMVGTTACTADARGAHFLYDAEGHLWQGVPPAPAADMSFQHLNCVDAVGGRPRGVLCGANRDVKVALHTAP